MAKARSLVNVTFGATGDTYEKGKLYDVPSALLEKYPDYFKKMTPRPQNKAKEAEENK